MQILLAYLLFRVKRVTIFHMARASFFILGILTVVSLDAYSADSDCQKWFQKSKLEGGSGCLLKCVSLLTDMSTFQCHEQCDELCKTSEGEAFVFKLSDLYPGLTAEERALAAENPGKALKAYQLSWKSEKFCQEDYASSQRNDESDACRHFVWASFMNKELGHDFTDKMLNAHEQEPRQPENEKAMDLANNRRGLAVSDRLLNEKRFDEKTIRSSFHEDLDHGRLIVLRRRHLPDPQVKP